MKNHLFIETDRQIYKPSLQCIKGLITWWNGFEKLESDIEEPLIEDMVETLQT